VRSDNKEINTVDTSNSGTVLITVQRDATQSSLFIILQVRSTCFRFQPNPSSGIHKTVTTASSTGHIFCAVTSLQRGQEEYKTVTTASGTGHIFCAATSLQRVTSTGGCSYSFVYF